MSLDETSAVIGDAIRESADKAGHQVDVTVGDAVAVWRVMGDALRLRIVADYQIHLGSIEGTTHDGRRFAVRVTVDRIAPDIRMIDVGHLLGFRARADPNIVDLGLRGTWDEITRVLKALVESGHVSYWVLTPGDLTAATPSKWTFSVEVTIA